ncbi:MAG: MBG domain-containing protein [Bacteroidota bacterium]
MIKYFRLIVFIACITYFDTCGLSQGFEEISTFIHDEAGAQFGQSLAIEGEIAVVRCELCPSGSKAFVYELSGSTWSKIAELSASMTESGGSFGRSIDIREDVIAIGNGKSRVYVFEKPAGGWVDMTENAILSSVAALRNGELVRITDKYILSFDENRRSVFVYEKNGFTWMSATETTEIRATGVSNFGRGIDGFGDTLLIASGSFNPGYLFIKPTTGWPSQLSLGDRVTELGSTAILSSNDRSRHAKITADHLYLTIEAKGTYIYERPSAGWGSELLSLEDHLLSPQFAAGSLWGFATDIAKDSVIVVGDRDFGGSTGAVEVYYKGCNGQWSSKSSDQIIRASDRAGGDRFGQGLAISEDFNLIVGADRIDRNGLTDVGGVYFLQNTDLLPREPFQGGLTATENGRLVEIAATGIISELATFSNSGVTLVGDLLEGSDKLLYGVSRNGGANGTGYLFRIYPDGRNFEVIHEFDGSTATNTGVNPAGTLLEINGKLYGTTYGDAAGNALSLGTIYSVNLDGSAFQTIYTSTTGENILSLHEASNGTLYASTSFGPSIIFKINTDGTGFNSIVSSGVTNFEGALAEVDGKLYGLATSGGANNFGYIFSIDLLTDAFVNEYDLASSDGRFTNNGLVALNGILYGSTLSGGSFGDGTIFTYDLPGGSYTKIYDYNFSGTNAKSNLTVFDNSSIYGFSRSGGTNDDGLLLEIIPADACNGAQVIEVASFESSTAQGPESRPLQITNTPPVISNQLIRFFGNEDDLDFSIDLSSTFTSSDEPVSNLDLVIESNSNPSLFSSLILTNSDDITQASLDVSLAPDAFGNADVVIKVRDARGGEAMVTQQFEIDAIPDIPSVTSASTTYGQRSSNGLVVTSNAADVVFPINNFGISNITNGALFTSDDVQITEGDFITAAEGSAGLRWEPASAIDGSFEIQAAFSPTSLRSDSFVANITVSKADLTITADDFSRPYDQDNPSFPVTYTGFVNNENESTLLSQASVSTVGDLGEPVGTYDLIPFGATADNYTITFVNGTLTITEAALSVVANDETIIYGQLLPVFGGTLTGVLSGDNITASYGSTADGQAAGIFDITSSLNDPDDKLSNYLVTNTPGTLTITQASLTATANNKEIVFGEAVPTLDGTVTGVVNGDNITASYTTTSVNNTDAGMYTIMVMLNDPDGRLLNYNVTLADGNLTINKADQQITFPAIPTIDLASTSTVTLGASSNSDLLIAYRLDQGDGSISDLGILTINAAGTFTITAEQTGDNNYNAAIDVTQTFTVTDSRKTNQTITFATIAAQEYGDQLTLGATASSNLPITYTLNTGVGTIINGILTIEGVGTYEITASQEGDATFNPAASVNQTFTVTKATLIAIADDQSIVEGDNVPVLTITYSGFKLADDLDDLDIAPTISTTATDQSIAGTYPISLSGGMDDLYDFSLTDGVLTIEPVLDVGDHSVTIYPNPTENSLTVEGLAYNNYQVISMDGKVLQSNRRKEVLDLSKLKAGQYLVQLIDNGQVIHKEKIIKR